MRCIACGCSVQIGMRRCPACKALQYTAYASLQADLENVNELETLPTQSLAIPDFHIPVEFPSHSIEPQSTDLVSHDAIRPDLSSEAEHTNDLAVIPTQHLSAAVTKTNTSMDLDVIPTQYLSAAVAPVANKQDRLTTLPTQHRPTMQSVPETPNFALPTAALNEHLAEMPTSQIAAVKGRRVMQGSNIRSLTTIGVAMAVIVLTSVVLIELLSAFPPSKRPYVQRVTSIVTPEVSRETGPSGIQVLSAAAQIITHPQTAVQIDNNYDVSQVQNIFAVNQTIYITFDIASTGRKGYIYSIWYSDNIVVHKDSFAHNPINAVGYFSGSYTQPTYATVELYWCTRYDCNDAQLAQIVHFTITSGTVNGGV